MRLIDADKLILYLNDYALQESPSDVESADDRKISIAVYKAIMDCIRAAEVQPTAYDADKVVELVDKTIKRRDPIWIDWEFGRRKFLRMCGKERNE